ncbi:tRNA (N(6)-L-threonylcarbamoyladenosine(37)-C(2))-methylthiotransferase MtaB [Gaoshiqia sediminis]|uniref:tRNA (N(6)-L-threonylcarbamoyladenosine(37)-C(2))-methylthiotransferase MtaB n=1 Tax=Gaoshiqia sediminis TaxID=2986998 RepID=A0AA42C897_9BACT|nr:tRNA (N(6)-L-threonylcarbamoyladenosine(37)-C(2))-methylthiotransferase MtaB [Gaoshiqia sediminis]MCW0484459.1 tRNA (N(6)-L-threonylcarbamoyladenosine(37)-C(2))-methylthiotransferase MtaB [Gaoshiqia sediminis]
MDYKGKKAAFFTLGCKLNFSETSTIARHFEVMGFERVDFKEQADVYVVNSCSVTAESDKKSRNIIRQAIRRNPNAVVVVTGCYAQLQADAIKEIKGVDYILGTNAKFRMTDFMNGLQKRNETFVLLQSQQKNKDFFHAVSWGDRTRSFLKVQDGCDYFCTYCTIPFARGRSRNDKISNTVAEARETVAQGIKEIILTGVNIGDFGKSTNEKFIDLLRGLDEVDGLERIRISSVEPNLLNDEIIDFVATSKRIMPHFHLPLQSGSNDVLQLMQRKYNRELFAERVHKIKSVLPNAFIGVDIIAGTNGETEAFFLDSYNFVKGLDVSQLHAFPYSERPGTKALEIKPVVPVDERKRRTHQLIMLSEKKLRAFYEQHAGQVRRVLFEDEHDNGRLKGFTDNYIRVEADYRPELVNQVCPVKLSEINNEGNFEVTLL